MTVMALASAPSTPVSQAGQAAGSNPPTGSWRHPRLDEISRRQNAATFNDRNVKSVLWNLVLLLITFRAPALLYEFTLVRNFLIQLSPFPFYALIACRVLMVINIVTAMLPLYRRKDDLADIPLTPSQRALLGLEPSSTRATPGSPYVTPPRYPRSATPKSSGGARGASPLSGKESPGGLGTQFSPSGSPLWQKAVGGGVTRRLSYGSNSPLGQFPLDGSLALGKPPGTPTASFGKSASVSLNSRWLYEKGLANSGV